MTVYNSGIVTNRLRFAVTNFRLQRGYKSYMGYNPKTPDSANPNRHTIIHQNESCLNDLGPTRSRYGISSDHISARYNNDRYFRDSLIQKMVPYQTLLGTKYPLCDEHLFKSMYSLANFEIDMRTTKMSGPKSSFSSDTIYSTDLLRRLGEKLLYLKLSEIVLGTSTIAPQFDSFNQDSLDFRSRLFLTDFLKDKNVYSTIPTIKGSSPTHIRTTVINSLHIVIGILIMKYGKKKAAGFIDEQLVFASNGLMDRFESHKRHKLL